MRRVVVCVLLSLSWVGTGCKRTSRPAPPLIPATQPASGPGDAQDADPQAEAAELKDLTLGAEGPQPVVASRVPTQMATTPDWMQPLPLGPVEDLPLLSDFDYAPEAATEPSPMDELGKVELFALEVDEALEESVSEDLRQLAFDIPVVLNKPVLQFLNYYQGRGRRIMEVGLQRSGRYLDFFKRVFEAEQVPRDLTYLPHVESLFKPRAYSRAHARGLWQFVRGTGRRYGLRANWWLDERSDVEKSTLAAARHLRDLYQEFGDWYLALAGYNCGPGRVRRILKRYGNIDYWEMRRRRLLPRETRNYVPSFLAALIIFKHPAQYGFDVTPEPPLRYEEIALDFQVDLRVVADLTGTSADEILQLNPQLRRGLTPYGEPGFRLKVPAGTAGDLASKLASLPADKRLKVKHYRVRRGDTLSGIASRQGSSVRAIAEMNRIRNVHRLRLGQDLLIPSAGWRAQPKVNRQTPAGRGSSYVVRNGDSLYRIARRHGLTVAQLAAWNNLRPSQTIFPGQRLRLHGDSGSSAAQK